jgi:hypothetical protein
VTEMEKLLKDLINGYEPDSLGGYPMTADEAADLIVCTLLKDLPKDRQDAVRQAIEDWATERERVVTGTVMEGFHD